MRASAWTICLAAWLMSGASVAEPRRYEIDPVHTRVWFEADHLGFSKALGAFSSPNGEIWFDAVEPSRSSVRVELALSSLDLGDADWNARVARKDLFWTAEHPVARFHSTRVEVDPEGRWQVSGELSLRGVTLPVVLHTRFNRAARHPLTLRQTVGFSAELTLSRAAFGMKSWKRMVADPILVRIEVEAKRKRGGESDDEGDDTDAPSIDSASAPDPSESTDPATHEEPER